MCKDSLKDKIDNIIGEIFNCNFSNISKMTLEISEEIETNNIFAYDELNKDWKEILYYLMISLENKDYLLLGDILNYELKTILKRV